MTLPQGTISCLFTDIEGSTQMSLRLPDSEYKRVTSEHDQRLHAIIADNNGHEVGTAGDSFFATFLYARDALACTVAMQQSLREEPIIGIDKEGKSCPVRVRVGVYKAARAVFLNADNQYRDREVNLASRIGAVGKGEQILANSLAYDEVRDAEGFAWKTWEGRRLKDFATPEDVHELLWDGVSRGEPGERFFPDWYLGETNVYIPRPAKEVEIIGYFSQQTGGTPIRLVTLKGFGGMGKTRLALACALRMVSLFKGRVHVVKLENTLPEAEAVAEAIGIALGLEGLEYLPDNLIAALRDSEALLLLDNYETVHCPSVQKFLRDLLHKTSCLRLLITGREAVKIAHIEKTVDVAGLTEPEARALFFVRAQLYQPGWQPQTAGEERALAAIVRLTERIPLALELVAAGMSDDAYGSIELVASNLVATPLPALPEGYIAVDPNPRHESLTRCHDYSYNLLAPAIQEGFVRLGLFADTFTPQTVEQAFGARESGPLLTRLSQASLITRIEPQNRSALHPAASDPCLCRSAPQRTSQRRLAPSAVPPLLCAVGGREWRFKQP